jgi:hypothetical protein
VKTGKQMSYINNQRSTLHKGASYISREMPIKPPTGTSSGHLKVLSKAPELSHLLPTLQKIPGAMEWLAKTYSAGASIKYLALASAMLIAFDWNRPAGSTNEASSILRAPLGHVNQALLQQFLKLAEKRNVSAEQLLLLLKGVRKNEAEIVVKKLIELDQIGGKGINKAVQAAKFREVISLIPSCKFLSGIIEPNKSPKPAFDLSRGANNIVPFPEKSKRSVPNCLMTYSASTQLPEMNRPEIAAILQLTNFNPAYTFMNISVVNARSGGSAEIVTTVSPKGGRAQAKSPVLTRDVNVASIDASISSNLEFSAVGTCNDGKTPATVEKLDSNGSQLHQITIIRPNQIYALPK